MSEVEGGDTAIHSGSPEARAREYKSTLRASAICTACIRSRRSAQSRCTTDVVDDAGEECVYRGLAHSMVDLNFCHGQGAREDGRWRVVVQVRECMMQAGEGGGSRQYSIWNFDWVTRDFMLPLFVFDSAHAYRVASKERFRSKQSVPFCS